MQQRRLFEDCRDLRRGSSRWHSKIHDARTSLSLTESPGAGMRLVAIAVHVDTSAHEFSFNDHVTMITTTAGASRGQAAGVMLVHAGVVTGV
jgi:Flp pilus assembly protein CpaB